MIELQNPALLRTCNYVDGQWIAADNGALLAVHNPANGALLAEVPCCGAAETRRAIAAAETALAEWRARPAKTRAQVLHAWFRAINDNAEDLARLITAECGKPLAEARGEVAYGASFVEWFAEEGKRTYGETIPSPQAHTRLLTIKQAVGVCAAITPWNFPLAMITRKVAPALAAGCTVVVKPAEATPLTALALAALAETAGLPAGVFNVVSGDPQAIGGELCANPTVRKLSFTGSTAVGRQLMAQCASRSCHWSWAATRPSSFSPMPMSTLRWKALWRRNTATPGKPASAPTAFWWRTVSTRRLPKNSPPASRTCRWAQAMRPACSRGR